MSAIDEFDFNNKFRFVLMNAMDITNPATQERSLNGSYALSPRQLQSIMGLFQLNDVQLKELNNLENLWGVFQPARKNRETGEFIRDQISILIQIGDNRTTRIFIRPARRDQRDAILTEMEAIRNPGLLMNALGDLSAATINRRSLRGAAPRPVPNAAAFAGAGAGAARHRPFEDKFKSFKYKDVAERQNA